MDLTPAKCADLPPLGPSNVCGICFWKVLGGNIDVEVRLLHYTTLTPVS